MARIIPERPQGKAGKSMLAFYRLLKKLPDDFTAWLALDERRPSVFLLWRERHGFLIEVAETTQELAETVIQRDFMLNEVAVEPGEVGQLESARLDDFISRAQEEMGPLVGRLPVKRLVVFPNVREGTVDEIVMLKGEGDVSYLGLHQSEKEQFARRIEALAEAALPEAGLVCLRRMFTPESVVPREFVVRESRSAPAELGGAFLDFDQEWCVKNDLELLPAQKSLVDDEITPTRLVTGVAGSGKSLVLLYRALLSAELHPGAKVLVLTHNRPLRHDLEKRSKRLEGIDGKIECRTFFQWAKSHLRDIGEVINPWETAKALEELRRDKKGLARFSTAYLADEIGWLKDQRALNLENYLKMERNGRGTAMTVAQRGELWELFRDYQKQLEREEKTDWHNVALAFHREVTMGRLKNFASYDAVFIDEAQFFAKVWFEVVRAALRPGGSLFLAADPTQGFLRRRQTWVSAGIDVRGRTTKLTQAYRNTRAILAFARDFYEERRTDGDSEDDLNVPDDNLLADIPVEGEPPVVIEVANPQEELGRAVNEVARLEKEGLDGGKLLILDADSARRGSLVKLLEEKLGRGQVWDLKEGPMPSGAFCGVTTLNAATGLEAPVVMLLGMSRLLEAESDPRLGEDERAELRRDHTRQLYMGFTRAGARLMVVRVGRSASQSRRPAR